MSSTEIAQGFVHVSLEPDVCICPNQSYYCRADLVSGMRWISPSFSEKIDYNILGTDTQTLFQRDGVVANFSSITFEFGIGNFTSKLSITEPLRWNETSITCEAYGFDGRNSTTVTSCIIGISFLCRVHIIIIL